MTKLVAVLFGLLVVVAGFAAATTWAVTSVRGYNSDSYGYSWTEIGVKYDVQHLYTNYYITYRAGGGGSYGVHTITGITIIPDPNGAETIVTIWIPQGSFVCWMAIRLNTICLPLNFLF